MSWKNPSKTNEINLSYFWSDSFYTKVQKYLHTYTHPLNIVRREKGKKRTKRNEEFWNSNEEYPVKYVYIVRYMCIENWHLSSMDHRKWKHKFQTDFHVLFCFIYFSFLALALKLNTENWDCYSRWNQISNISNLF